MIPDFPKAKEKLRIFVDISIRQEIKTKSPLLAMVPKQSLYEGDKTGVLYEDGTHSVEHLNEASSKMSISSKQMRNMSSEDVLTMFSDMSADVANQIEGDAIQAIAKSMADSGNIVNVSEVGPDIILKGMENVKIYFHNDDRNKPSEQSLIVHPTVSKRLMEIEKKQTPQEKAEFDRKKEEILDKKFEEHMADVKSRKIID